MRKYLKYIIGLLMVALIILCLIIRANYTNKITQSYNNGLSQSFEIIDID